MKSLYKKLIISAAAVTACAVFVLVSNKSVGTSEFEITSPGIPEGFDGFRIVQVSDLHNESFGENNSRLLAKIEKLKPDAIAVTGDIVDSYSTDVAVAEGFIRQAVKIAPVYYVTGNHEFRTATAEYLKNSFEELGVKVLCGEGITVERGGEGISFYGIDDPRISGEYLSDYEAVTVKSELEALGKGDGFSILLSHRPEYFELYEEYGFDLVLTGHAHGGQFRVPFIGGVYAPGQGFLPEYDSGRYEKNGTTMLVSRGLGNSVIPLRVNNNPELIAVTIKKEVK